MSAVDRDGLGEVVEVGDVVNRGRAGGEVSDVEVDERLPKGSPAALAVRMRVDRIDARVDRARGRRGAGRGKFGR